MITFAPADPADVVSGTWGVGLWLDLPAARSRVPGVVDPVHGEQPATTSAEVKPESHPIGDGVMTDW